VMGLLHIRTAEVSFSLTVQQNSTYCVKAYHDRHFE